MADQIIEDIPMYQPNDPYYYEVDNIPLEYLLENQKRLQAQIDEYPSLETIARMQWVEENFVSIVEYNSRILGGVSDVDFTGRLPEEGDVLVFSEEGTWNPYRVKADGLEYLNITSGTANAPDDSLVFSDGEKWVHTLDTGGKTTLHDMVDFFHDPNSSDSDNWGLGWNRTTEQFFTIPGMPNDEQLAIMSTNVNPNGTPWAQDPWATLKFFENEYSFISLQTLLDVADVLTGPWTDDPGPNPHWHETNASYPNENQVTLPGKYNDNGTLKDIRLYQGFKAKSVWTEKSWTHYYPHYPAPQNGWSSGNRDFFFTHVTTWSNSWLGDQDIRVGSTAPYSWQYIHFKNERMHGRSGHAGTSLCYLTAAVVTP